MPYAKVVISERTGLINIPEYFAVLQGLFDTVKQIAKEQEGKERYDLDRSLLEEKLSYYLPDKDLNKLVNYFSPYEQRFLDKIHNLKYKFGDGMLVKSIEDIILAGILKNEVKYDYVVGNPPYVRIQGFTKSLKNIINQYIKKPP